MNIKNYLKLKKYPILFFLLLGIFAFGVSYAQAGEIKYIPNLAIPGSAIFGGGEIIITPNTLAEYIKAIYRYAGILAGAFAMFMLVYGAWQWLMAGGNASKVTMAKETVTTTLIGLAFLFGGYLLLSQISVNLVNFQPLVIEEPKMKDDSLLCAEQIDNYPCGLPFEFEYQVPGTQGTSTIKCSRGYKCEDEKNCQYLHTEGGVSIWWDCKGNSNASNCMCRTGESGEIAPGSLRFMR